MVTLVVTPVKGVVAGLVTPKKPIGLRTIGERLRWVIEEHLGTTQTEFAHRIGVKRPQLSRWINNPNRPPSEEYVRRIAAEAGISPAWLRYGVGSPIGEEPEAPEPEAEIVIGSFDGVARHLGGIAPPGQEKLRKLDALEAIADYYRAIGERLPHDWWELKRRVENDEL